MKQTNKVHLDMSFRMLHDGGGFFVEVCSARTVQRVWCDDKEAAYVEMASLLGKFGAALVDELKPGKSPELKVVE